MNAFQQSRQSSQPKKIRLAKDLVPFFRTDTFYREVLAPTAVLNYDRCADISTVGAEAPNPVGLRLLRFRLQKQRHKSIQAGQRLQLVSC